MPFVSAKQQRWGHTSAGIKALGGKASVHEWDMATKSQGFRKPVSHKGSLRNAVKKRKGHVPHAVSPFYKKTHKTYNV